MKIRTIPSILGRIAAFYQGRILLSLPFLVFCWFWSFGFAVLVWFLVLLYEFKSFILRC